MMQTLQEILSRLCSLDRDVLAIAWLSLRVSLTAVGIGLLLGIPLGAFVAVARFPGRGAVVGLLNAFMGLPPVLVGLALYLVLSRSGPLGPLGLYTRTMTTAISLETQKGDLSLALALGIVLIGLVLVVNVAVALLRRHAARVYG
jgi:ABC-type tungstate transport system substrate-binding protein